MIYSPLRIRLPLGGSQDSDRHAVPVMLLTAINGEIGHAHYGNRYFFVFC